MNIVSERYFFGDDFTLSRVSIDGQPFAACPYILENKVRQTVGQPVQLWKIPGKTAIPVGTYNVIIDHSWRFDRDMMHLLNVPGYDGIRVHAGNTSMDTEGCLLVGMSANQKHGEVMFSRMALASLYDVVKAALERAEAVTWTVKGLPFTRSID